MAENKLQRYEAPKIETYTDNELLEKLGPAYTGYVNCPNWYK